jgi:hypothetical protein
MNKQPQLAVPQNNTFIIALFTPCPTYFKLGSSKHVGDVKNYRVILSLEAPNYLQTIVWGL